MWKISAAETRITRCYSGKTMRVIRNPYVDDWERRPQDIRPFPEQMNNSARDGVLDFATGGDPDVERTCMPCGQGAGGILEIASCAEIIDSVMSDARKTISNLARLAGD